MFKQLKRFGFNDDLIISSLFLSKFKNFYKTYKNQIFHNLYKPLRKSQIKSHDYRYYYDKEMIDIINIKCQRELKLFGYNFNDINFKNASFKNDQVFFDTSNLNYNIHKDKMSILND